MISGCFLNLKGVAIGIGTKGGNKKVIGTEGLPESRGGGPGHPDS